MPFSLWGNISYRNIWNSEYSSFTCSRFYCIIFTYQRIKSYYCPMIFSIQYELSLTTSWRRWFFYFSVTGCRSFSSYDPAPLLHTHFLQPTIFLGWRKVVGHPFLTPKSLYVGKGLSWNTIFQFLSHWLF
jgi:hypothetical protein